MNEENSSQDPQEEGLSVEEMMKEQEQLDYKKKYLEALADNENARKRLQKEKEETKRFAVENVLCDFLNPIDSFENALKMAETMSPEVKNWAFGFQMILAQFKEILSQNGVESFTSINTPFNPNLHEAVEIEETDRVPENTVTKEFVCGYKCKERVLRPARVTVAKKVIQKEES